MSYTVVSNVVIPSVFTAYMQALTEQKSRFVQAGVLVRDPALRERIVANARQYIREERNGDVMRGEWNAAVSG